jgi:hypothetical protein
MHEAKASDVFSLHVTVGLFPFLWADIVREALDAGSEEEQVLREGATILAQSAGAAVPAALQRVCSAERLAAARQRLKDRFAKERRNALDGQLQQIVYLSELSSASRVELRRHLLFRMEEEPSSCTLSFSGKAVRLPAGAAAIVRALERDPGQSVEALERLEPKALDIVRRLIKEGFALQTPSRAISARSAGEPADALREVATH